MIYKLTLVTEDAKKQIPAGEFPTYEQAHNAGMQYGSVFFIDNFVRKDKNVDTRIDTITRIESLEEKVNDILLQLVKL